MIDLSANFANYMRVKYPEVYKVSKDSKQNIYRLSKLKTESCSQLILSLYNVQFRKLEKCQCKYHCDVKYGCAVVPASSKMAVER